MMNKPGLKIAAVCISLFFLWLGLELMAQVYFYVVLTKKIGREIAIDNGSFIFKKADKTGYDIKPNLNFNTRGLNVHINAEGLRDKLAPTSKKKKIALMGDSVVFGYNQDQDSTIAQLTNRLIDSSMYVTNLGVPGYNSEQITQHFYDIDQQYGFSGAVYILNPNDFTTLNTIYEGGDNGVNRYLNPPIIKTPWLIRKLVYRLIRFQDTGAAMCNPKWYRWLFKGTKADVFEDLEQLQAYCKTKGIGLTVVPLPSGESFSGKSYGLMDMHSEILGFLKAKGINSIDLVPAFMESADPRGNFDNTDHMYGPGNVIIAKELAKHIK